MRDKIARYLENGPQSAQQILSVALNIESPNSATAEVVLKSLVGADQRFRSHGGFWSLADSPAVQPTAIAALALEWNLGHPRCYRGAICFPGTGSAQEFLIMEPAGDADAGPLARARAALEGHLLLAWRDQELRHWKRLLRSCGLPDRQEESLALSALAARAMPGKRLRNADDLAPVLDLPPPDAGSPASVAHFMCRAYENLLAHIPVDCRSSTAAISHWMEEGNPKVDFTRFGFGRELLARIPESPGVYLMRDRAGELIYVGKSRNLRRRVRSYFTPRSLSDPKVSRIHQQLYSIEVLTCATEIEALLLEIRMIRDFRPIINLQSEIHERPGSYGMGKNLLILLPVGQKAHVYFLKDGVFKARRQVALGSKPEKMLFNKIRSVFYGAGRKSRSAQPEEWKSEIVASWFSGNRRRLNYIDVDECGAFDEVARRLESYLKDPDRLAHKVYYRR